MNIEDMTDKLETFRLSPEHFAELRQATDDAAVDAFWRKYAVEYEFYPQTVDWPHPDNPVFLARRIDRHTSIEDLDNGWTFNDWMTGWGPGEKWRVVLNRKLNPLESRRVNVRLSQQETWNPETGEYDLDLTLEMLRRLSEDDLHVVKCRRELIEATEIKDGWVPVFTVAEDVEISTES